MNMTNQIMKKIKNSKTYSCPVTKVPIGIYKQLYSLNFGGDWDLRPTLVTCRKYGCYEEGDRTEAWVHYILDMRTGIVLGWSLTFEWKRAHWAYFYVRKQARRSGIGRRLVLRASRHNFEKHGENTHIRSYSPETRNFFEQGKQFLKSRKLPWEIVMHYR